MDNRIEELVTKYAKQQGVAIDSAQAIAYKDGLERTWAGGNMKPTIEEKMVDVPPELGTGKVSFKYVQAVEKYAESQGKTLSDEQVQKYARGLLSIFQEFKPAVRHTDVTVETRAAKR